MVSKNLLREVILEQRSEMEEIFQREKIIEREPKQEVKRYLKFPNILAVLGVRRAGKSIFSWQIFKDENFGYINFDDERLIDLKAKDLNKILEVFYEYGKVDSIILDEPHNVRGWELFANRLRRTKKVIITGSNSKLLSGELATHLTGRHITFELFPFNFNEFLKFQDRIYRQITTKERAEISGLLQEFLQNGSFPEYFKFGRKIVREVYDNIITKDVLRRGKIKKEVELKKVANFLINNFSKEFTFRSLKSITLIKHLSTLSKWINLLQEAYLVFIIERFSFKLKQPIIAPKKVYCIDNGIVNAIGFRVSENIGRLMENLTAVELKRRRSYWHENWEIFYWKDHQQREVDFVVKEGLRVKELIQVTYASEMNEIERREIKGLLKASKELKCKNLKVITWDYESEEEFKNRKIKFIPLWRWLLGL